MAGPPTADAAPRFQCPVCRQSYRIRNAHPAGKYLCQRCKAALELVGTAGTVGAMPEPPQPARRLHLASAATMYEPPPQSSAPGATAPVPGLIESGPPSSLPRLRNEPPKGAPAEAAGADTVPDDLLLDAGREAAPQPVDLRRLLPAAFDGYRVIRELARGGMGAVLMAEQSELRRKAALKIMLPWAGTDQAALQERFTREGRALAKLRHPHIVEVYGVGTVSGMPYLAMELVEGRTLSQCIADDRLGYAAAAEAVAKVARALAYAHSRGVIHRDIKPANIMLRDNGEPVLMDFGLAKDFDANSLKLSVTGNIMGTPAYMSPEQAQGLKVNERSDIYSLGAVLYEALTLEPPFGGETTIATMYNVVNTPARPASEIRPGVPEDLSRICAKALEKDPADRYHTMDEFAGDLDRFGAGLRVAAQGPSTIRRAVDFARANRVRSAALGAAVAVLLGVLLALQIGWLRSGTSKAAEVRAAIMGGTPEARTLYIKALTADLRDKRFLPGTPEYQDVTAALRAAVADTEPSGEVAAAAAEALGAAGDHEAQEPLARLLDQAYPTRTRRAAVLALAKVGVPDLAHLLERVIRHDSSVEVRLTAIESMPARVTPDILTFMMELAAKGEPPVIAAAATQKLGELRPCSFILADYGGGGSAAAANAMSKMLSVKREYQQELDDAVAQLDTKPAGRPKPQPYELAARKLRSEDRAERMQAAYDLGVLCDVRAEPALVGALQDGDTDVALTAAEALGRLPELNAPAKVVELLSDPSPSIRRVAARACARFKPPPDGAALVKALLAEKIGPVQSELAAALGRLKFSGAVVVLVGLLSEGAPEARRRAIWALGQIGDRNACGPLVELLDKSADQELREDIAAALSAITGEAIGPDAQKWREALRKGK